MDHTTTVATLTAFKVIELAMYVQFILAVCWMGWSIEIGQLISKFTHFNQRKKHENHEECHQSETANITA